MVETYLSTRKTLKGVVLILDIRRIPGTEEFSIIDWLEYYRIPIILALTKSDKLSKIKQIKQHLAIAKALSVGQNDLILFSSKSRLGKEAVWNAIKKLIDSNPKRANAKHKK